MTTLPKTKAEAPGADVMERIERVWAENTRQIFAEGSQHMMLDRRIGLGKLFAAEMQQYGDERAAAARNAAIEEAALAIDLYDKPLYSRPELVALIRALAIAAAIRDPSSLRAPPGEKNGNWRGGRR